MVGMYNREESLMEKSIHRNQISRVYLYDKSINDNYIYLTKDDGADKDGFHDKRTLDRLTQTEIKSYDFIIDDKNVYYKPMIEIILIGGEKIEKRYNTYSMALKEYKKITGDNNFISI